MPRPVDNPPNPWATEHVEWLGEPPEAQLAVHEEEASSILDTEQKKEFDNLQQRSRDDMERLRDMVESGNMPLFPGAPQPPQGGKNL